MVTWTSKAWVALQGAAEYAAAIARGDVADDAAAWARGGTCAACLSKTCNQDKRLLGYTIKPRMVFCGPALSPQPESVLPTCGCLVLVEAGPEDKPPEGATPITIAGREYAPAGKARVGSQRCPQGRW